MLQYHIPLVRSVVVANTPLDAAKRVIGTGFVHLSLLTQLWRKNLIPKNQTSLKITQLTKIFRKIINI